MLQSNHKIIDSLKFELLVVIAVFLKTFIETIIKNMGFEALLGEVS